MTAPSGELLQRYLRHRRPIETAVWVLAFALHAIANTLTVGIDIERHGLPVARWEFVTWELSSHVVALALVPPVLAAVERWPLHWGALRRHLPWHLLASLVFSAVHVAGMVAIRKGVYALQGMHYDFGTGPRTLLYEALKDVRLYALLAAIWIGYRLLLWRWQGEARLLVAADAPPAGDEPRPAAAGTTPTGVSGAAMSPDVAIATPDPIERPERFLVKKLGKEFLLPTAEIEWVQACGNYVNLHRAQHDYPLRATLSGLEQRLDPARFVRVHRSWLVNLSLVDSIEPLETGDARVRMRDGSSVPCSRTHLEALRQRAA